MIAASVDPGSRCIAVTITSDDAAPLRYVAAQTFDVGTFTPFAVPEIRIGKPRTMPDGTVEPGKPYTVKGTWSEVDDDERHVVAAKVAWFIIKSGAEVVAVEEVKRINPGKTPQATGSMSEALLLSSKIAERVLTLWREARTSKGLPFRVRSLLVASWRARLVPMVKADMAARGEVPEGVLIKSHEKPGGHLDRLLAAHVVNWPGGATWGDKAEHVLDSTGLALACALPALERAPRKPAGPRVRKPPRERGPRYDRVRGKMGPVDLEKYRATDRARGQRERDAQRVANVAARAAAGCTCRAPGESLRGRHKATCPQHVAKVAPARGPMADPLAYLEYLRGSGR